MEITFAGAAREVTGSCHLVHVGGRTIALDFGLFQGHRRECEAKNRELPFDVGDVDCVVLSHAHIDHAGRLPYLMKHGYRKDIMQFSIQDAATGRSDPSGLKSSLDEATVSPLGPKASGHTSTTGVMARPLPWLGVFYNVSSTFDIGDTYYDPYGNTYPGAAGDGFDRGVQIDLWQDRFSLRVNQYENTLGPTATNAGRLGALTDVAAKIEQRVRQLDPGLERINPGRGFPDLGFSNYRPTADTVSRGYEFTLNVRPTRNWTTSTAW